ncbi:unnamed protein product (macronuclear) [Paramecium tetraurelia]|uniref:Uncharacterized protein n=1 Tax=Paramecium tetraurelia TaxID=5888 RepID=A0BAQ7_PARTE|nr:uncharacterized protein GSPATT00000059001 [Paramecium tetraurelia]CAK55624.1 unnamed protein product [Paramecium tetraurelia]|eukprot:XP_001423022.1 hypothetical protein (macronuclear) [Paramecium tetraurelia strain d4-2]
MDNKSKGSSKSRKELGGMVQYSLIDELSLKGVSLFKLDVNYDHLKQFLEGVQADLDNHTVEIEGIKKLLGPNEIILLVQEQFQLLSDSLHFSDKDIEKELSTQLSTYITQIQGKQKYGKGALEKIITEFRGKLFSVISMIQHLYREKKRQDQRLTKLENDMLTKFDTKECKEKMRKQKNQLEQQIEDLQKNGRNELDTVEKKLSTDIQKFEEAVRDVERKTLWKIHDCQDLLLKRTNEEFVNEAIRTSEDKILKEIQQMQNNDQLIKFQQDIAYIRSQIKGIDDTVGEKQSKLKLQLNEMNDLLKSKINLIDKLVEQNKQQGDKIIDINSRLATAINKLDVSNQLDQHRQKIKQLEDGIQRLNDEAKERVEALKDMNLNAENVAYLLSKIDPHKICTLEGDIKKLEEMSIRNNVHWETLDAEFKSRYDSFQFFSQLYQQQQQQQQQSQTPEESKYVTKDEINRMFEQFQQQGSLEDDKIRKIQKDLQDIGHKVENANEIERRVTRIFRDVDINGLMRQVKVKANEDDVKRELFNLETRLGQAMETINYLRREIEALQVQLKKSPMNFQQSASPPTDQIIGINTKKLYPINCLSCSTTNQQRVKGTDGKYYQADMKRQTIDQQQFYDLQQDESQQFNQQHYVQRPQSAVVNKQSNGVKRPVSAKK